MALTLPSQSLKGNTMERINLKTNADYIEALKRLIVIMDANPGSDEAIERELLMSLLKKYEQKHIILPELDLMPS